MRATAAPHNSAGMPYLLMFCIDDSSDSGNHEVIDLQQQYQVCLSLHWKTLIFVLVMSDDDDTDGGALTPEPHNRLVHHWGRNCHPWHEKQGMLDPKMASMACAQTVLVYSPWPD